MFATWARRLRARWSRCEDPTLSIDSAGLVVVAQSFDDAEAASSALARAARWDSRRPAVLRHHLMLPEPAVDRARELLAQDGWTLRPGGQDTHPRPVGVDHDTDRLVALRVQELDAVHCSQESSRMASLAQRLRGRALGWDALQPANEPDHVAGC